MRCSAIRAWRPEGGWFWSTHGGADLDLLVSCGGRLIGVEIKRTDAPPLSASMRQALRDLDLDRLLVVTPGDRAIRSTNGHGWCRWRWRQRAHDAPPLQRALDLRLAYEQLAQATMAALSVRGLSEAQLAHLKQEARRQGISVNRLVLQRLGSAEPESTAAGNDPLLRLAGTWTQEDADAFAAAIAPLEQVDSDLWT